MAKLSIFYGKVKNMRLIKWLIIIIGITSIFLTLVFSAMEVTSSPKFCTTCHQNRAAVTTWSKAPHKDVTCLKCHADPGNIGYVKRKIGGLREVYMQLSGSYDPNHLHAEINLSTCIGCHTKPNEKYPKATMISSSHKSILENKISCLGCHKTVGHGDYSKNKEVEVRQ